MTTDLDASLEVGIEGGIEAVAKTLGDHDPKYTVRSVGPNAKVATYRPANNSDAEVQLFVMAQGNEIRSLVAIYPKPQGWMANRIIALIKWIK